MQSLRVRDASNADVSKLLALRIAVDEDQQERFGKQRWRPSISDRSVRRALEASRVLVAELAGDLVGTLRIAGKKPWSIDLGYFTEVPVAVYLHDVEVAVAHRRKGIGRRLLDEAVAVAKAWPADAIRLDAYDGASGGGPFYASFGFRERGRVVYRSVPLIYYEMVL